jgi:hypothetical protein
MAAHPKPNQTHRAPAAGHAHAPKAAHPKTNSLHHTPAAGPKHAPNVVHPKTGNLHHGPVVGHVHATNVAYPRTGNLDLGRTDVVVAETRGYSVLAYPAGVVPATVVWSDAVVVSPSTETVLSASAGVVVADQESEFQPAQLRTFAERFLEVANETNESVTVYVQYRSAKTGSFSWAPADPRSSKQAVSFQLAPGQKTQISHDETLVRASKVRIWAEGANGGRWNQHQSSDLWLVPETNDQGQHVYQAADMETRTYAIR